MLERAPSLVWQIVNDIEKRIFSGALPPGSKVRESKLAAELGVSRGPVREACHTLIGDRLMVPLPNKGSHVRWIPPAAAKQLFEIREELSGLIARGIAKGNPTAAAALLSGHLDRIDNTIATRDTAGFFPANLDFHSDLLAATGNDRLAEIYLGIFKELRIFRLQSLLTETKRPGVTLEHNAASNAGHRQIVAAIGTGDAQAIERTMRAQVAASRDRSALAFSRGHLDVPPEFSEKVPT